VLAACSGSNDGTLVTRSTIALRGAVDDGLANSPLAGAACEAVDLTGTRRDLNTAGTDGAFLLLVPEGFHGLVRCRAPGLTRLSVAAFVSTTGLVAGDDLFGVEVDPARTIVARAMVHAAADDPELDLDARLAVLEAALAADPSLGALAETFTAVFEILRSAGVDADTEALFVDLFEDGRLDGEAFVNVAAEAATAVAAVEAARGVTLRDAFGAVFTGPRVTLLHNSGGESALREAGAPFVDAGGVARFATRVAAERAAAEARGAALLVTPGNFSAPGPELAVSLVAAADSYDVFALQRLGYDAIALGPRDLALGPVVAANIVDRIEPPVPLVSSNINFQLETFYRTLAAEGRLVSTLGRELAARRAGIVSAISPEVARFASPRRLQATPAEELVETLQAQVDALRAEGVRIIVLLSQQTDLAADRALAEALSGVDLVVAGGGDALLANPGDALVPGDEDAVVGDYPQLLTGADGAPVALVSTAGRYRYLGRLQVRFDAFGEIAEIDAASGPQRIVGGAAPDATEPDNDVQTQVIDPLQSELDVLTATVAADSEVDLDLTAGAVATRETNFGDLLVDAVFLTSRTVAGTFGFPPPIAAVVEAASFTADRIVPAGPLTRGDVFELAPSDRLIAVLPSVSPVRLKALLERGVAGDGAPTFLQVANLTVEFDPAGTAQVVDATGAIVTPGSRIRRVVLGTSQVLVEEGEPVTGAPAITLAATDRLARGELGFPVEDQAFQNVGVDLRQALDNYLISSLRGNVRASDFPVEGRGRIVEVSSN
jgi:5'-nucleotidase